MNNDGIMGYEVTIGIPVYNVERYIRRAMESALAQTFQSIEFLICDDCGTDASMDIVREYQSKHPRGADIRIVSQPYNKGLGEARNLMIDSAAGKYLCFLDADDAMTEDAVSLLYESLISHHADIVYGSHERIEDFDGQRQVYPFIYPSLSFHKENEFATWAYETYGRMGTTTWNFLIDINIYRKNSIRYKPINFWEDMTTTIDLPTYVSRVVLLPNITYRYYCHYGSLSNFQKRDVIQKEEMEKTVQAMKKVKEESLRIKNKPYYPKRCQKVMMTCFYMACTMIKYRKITQPPFSKREIRDLMTSPLGFTEILGFKTAKWPNLALYLLGILPPGLSVFLIHIIGKQRRLI
jgi:glycosyltransferase involved in cell wall biosynthesis